jgi:hypothetical protein
MGDEAVADDAGSDDDDTGGGGNGGHEAVSLRSGGRGDARGCVIEP